MPLTKSDVKQPDDADNISVDLKDAKPPQSPKKPRKPRKDKGMKRGSVKKPMPSEIQYHFKFLAVAITAALAARFQDPAYNATPAEAEEFDKAIDELLNYYAEDLEALTPWFRLISVSMAYSMRILIQRRPRRIQKKIDQKTEYQPVDFDKLTPDEIKKIEDEK